MTTTRLALALNELAAALLESIEGGTGAGSSSPAPATAFATAKPAQVTGNAGDCPVHGTPWRTTKGDGTPAKRAYCSGKMEDDSYCSEKGPWLQSR
jgi:hypothetical protein